MKNRKINFIKLGIFLFGISLLLWNCEDEIISSKEVQQKNISSRISFKEFERNINTNTLYSKIFPHFKTKNSYSERNIDSINSTILTDEIVKMELENYSTYTFKIETESEENQFYNLVIFVNNSNEVYNSKILKYTSSQEWIDNQSEPFTGTVNIINNDIFNTNNLLSSRSSGNCVTGVHSYWECSYGNNHAPGTINCIATTFEVVLSLEYGPCSGSNENNNIGPPSLNGGSASSSDGNENEIPTTPLQDPNCPPFSGKIYVDGVCLCPIGYIEDPATGYCIEDDCNTSKEDLKKIFPNASDATLSTLASVLNEKGQDFGINTKEKLQHFLAQAGHETGGFGTLNITENLNYSTASLIPKRYRNFTMDTVANPTKLFAGNYINDSEKLANAAYCCRYENGDEASGDGWRYRGRGIFQLTWKENYRRFEEWYNNKYEPNRNFISNPNLISENDTLAILSGLWYFKNRVLNRVQIDENTSVRSVTRPINSAQAGISDRKNRFQIAKDSIKCK